jgi:hypothetical protein
MKKYELKAEQRIMLARERLAITPTRLFSANTGA